MCNKSSDIPLIFTFLFTLLCGNLVFSYPDSIHHRIVIKNKYRRPIQNYKEHHVDYHRQPKKPVAYDSSEDSSGEYSSYPQENFHYANKNENVKNKTRKPQKPFKYSLIDLTTAFPSELSVPRYESTFSDYFPPSNKSSDFEKSSNYHLQLNNLLSKLIEKNYQGQKDVEISDHTGYDYQVREENEGVKLPNADYFNLSGQSPNIRNHRHGRPNYSLMGARSFN